MYKINHRDFTKSTALDIFKLLAAEFKKKCGCGGAVKDGDIEIQGDVREQLNTLIEAKDSK